MANQEYVNFRRGLKHPKLGWVISMLNKLGIPHRVKSKMNGPMLQVGRGHLEMATGILEQEIVNLNIAPPQTYNGDFAYNLVITMDDLADDHELFDIMQNVDTGVLKFQSDGEVKEIDAETLEEIPAPVTLSDVLADPSIPLSDEQMDQLFDSGPDTFADTIEVAAVVSDADEFDFSFDDDDDDEDEAPVAKPVVDESFADADPAEPPKPRKNREPKEVKAAIDPDFDEAVTEDLPAAAPTSKNFLHADEMLSFVDEKFEGVTGTVRMYDCESTNVSAIGAKVIDSQPTVVTLYTRYKSGSSPYRYNPVARADFNELLNEIIRKKEGIQEASVGSMHHHMIKVPAEEGRIQCQRYNEEKAKWVKVLTKAERAKQTALRSQTNK